MGSVNPTTPARLPVMPAATDPQQPEPQRQGWDLSDGLTAMGMSIGSTLTDVATFAGMDTDEEGNLRAGVNPVALGGFAAATAGPTALMALANRIDPLTGASSSYLDRLGTQATVNGIRITPTLISAVAGPAIADGVSMIAPNLVKKYRDPKTITDATKKREAERDNQQLKITRAVAGGAVVGLIAGAVFLLRPDIFRRFGSGVAGAIEGSTTFAVNGQVTKLPGVLNAEGVRTAMASIGRPLMDSDAVNIMKTVSPMAKDAAFSNRLLVTAGGGVGTLLLADRAAGETDPDKRRLMFGIAAATGAATLGGAWGIGKLTQRSISINSGSGGLLAKNQMFMKPNVEWVKTYAKTIAPITAVPAGTAASQYFNIVDDFDKITDARSPFRK